MGTTPVWQKSSDVPADDDEISDDSDEGEFQTNIVAEESGAKKPTQRLRPRPPYDLYGKKPTVVEGDEEIQDLLAESRGKKEEKLQAFLNDPATTMKIFLSSYVKDQGLI